MRQHLRWFLGLVLIAPQAAHAQEPKSVDPVVVTATGVPTPTRAARGLDQRGQRGGLPDLSLPDRRRGAPQRAGRRDPPLGLLRQDLEHLIRGANSNQVQVLVDGVRVKSSTLGTADLSDLSPDLIERIEVIRGAQSTLYGADAIGGVVNIITRKGSGGPFQATTQQEVGNYDTYASGATIRGAYKIFNYAASGSHFESNGQFQNDEHRRQRVQRAHRAGPAALGQLALLHLPLEQERHRRAREGRVPRPPAEQAHHQPERQAAVGDHHLQPRGQDAAGRVVGEPGPHLELREQPGLPGSGGSRFRLRRSHLLAGERGAAGGGVGELVPHRQVEHQQRRARVSQARTGRQRARLP